MQGNKDMRILCAFLLNIENQNSKQRLLGPKQNTKIQIKVPTSKQEPPGFSTAPIQDNKDMRFVWTFKLNTENPNLEQRLISLKELTKIKIKIPNSSEDPPA